MRVSIYYREEQVFYFVMNSLFLNLITWQWTHETQHKSTKHSFQKSSILLVCD